MPRALLPRLVAALLGASAGTAGAVQLNPDGTGQALLYPYYTARSAGAGAFQTLLSIVNHTNDAKSLRVRFREGERSQAVAEFNLYLGPHDMWTGAVIPSEAGANAIATLVSNDSSCVDPPAPAAGRTFSPANLPGDTVAGAGRARTLEGHLEVIEMATLTGTSAAAVTHSAVSGLPANCTLVTDGRALSVGAPSGGLSGTLTLIDVLGGSDFTVNADALAALSAQPFHRPATDPYPGFDAAEISATSVVETGGRIYRAAWSRGLDAVAAVLSRREGLGEFVLDAPTQSRTDMVVTFPLRSYGAPLTGPDFTLDFRDRESRGTSAIPCTGPFAPNCSATWSFSTNVVTFDGNLPHTQDAVGILASANGALVTTSGGGFNQPPMTVRMTRIALGTDPVANGSVAWRLPSPPALTSLPASQVIDATTGQVTAGAQVYSGLPAVGFTLRTFRNGAVPCGTATCQGNYGGAFPLKFRRDVAP